MGISVNTTGFGDGIGKKTNTNSTAKLIGQQEFQEAGVNASANTAAQRPSGEGEAAVSVSISEEGKKAQETAEAKREETEEATKQTGSVGVNAGKRARQIAAAKTQAQVRAVLALLRSDLQQCEAGLKKGMCDQSEIDKVKALIAQAKQRMGQVSDREATPAEEAAFAMASLM